MREDVAAGAFLDWYDYDGTSHSLWSRFHVFGIRDEQRYWKVQILGYYGEDFGAPVGAVYRLRYAEVQQDGPGETMEVEALDATAGYPDVTPDSGSGCIDLDTGEQSSLSPDEARQSERWHLCFRRDTISVNGDLGGPRGVAAVNLSASSIEQETLGEVQERTAESELERFDSVDYDALTKPELDYRGDQVISIFEGCGPRTDHAATSVWLTFATYRRESSLQKLSSR